MTSIETLCPSNLYVLKKHQCTHCNFRSQFKWVVRRHMQAKHNNKNDKNQNQNQNQALPISSDNVENQVPPPTSLNSNNVNKIETGTSNKRKRKSNTNIENTENISTEIKKQRIENETNPVVLPTPPPPLDNVENQLQPTSSSPSNNLDEIKQGKKRKFDHLNNFTTHTTGKDLHQVSPAKKAKSGDIILSSGHAGILVNDQILEGPFNLELIENFKISIFGPSRSGKTNFLSDILRNLDAITSKKPDNVYYIFTEWQDKLDELRRQGLVDKFLEGHSGIETELKQILKPNEKNLVIFDDQASRKEVVEFVGNLFSIHARHSNMSVIWVSQIIFDGNNVRNIRKNSDYIVIFKCPQDCLDIIHLSRQMTKGKLLQDIYEHVTDNEPYSYVFCDVTQESDQKIKFRSHIFQQDGLVRTYVPI